MRTQDKSLCAACYAGYYYQVKAAIASGADVNCEDDKKKGGYTPLWYAALSGNTEIVDVLLDFGADVLAMCGTDGDTPLHAAAKGGSIDTCRQLIMAGASGLLKNSKGEYPSNCARKSGHIRCAFYLTNDKDGWLKDAEIAEGTVRERVTKDIFIQDIREMTTQHKMRLGLVITIVSAAGLVPRDINGKSDPYAVLFFNKKQYKTKVANNTLDPVWNETFEIPVATSDDFDKGLRIEIFDYDMFKSDDFEGQREFDILRPPLDLMDPRNLRKTFRVIADLHAKVGLNFYVKGTITVEFTAVNITRQR